MHRDQVTVCLTADQRAFLSQLADHENRTISGQLRQLIHEAMRRAGRSNGSAITAFPTRKQINTAEELAEARKELADLETERDKFLAREKKSKKTGFVTMSATDAERLRVVQSEIYEKQKALAFAERWIGDSR